MKPTQSVVTDWMTMYILYTCIMYIGFASFTALLLRTDSFRTGTAQTSDMDDTKPTDASKLEDYIRTVCAEVQLASSANPVCTNPKPHRILSS